MTVLTQVLLVTPLIITIKSWSYVYYWASTTTNKNYFLSPAYTAIAPTKTFVHLPLVGWLENSIRPCLHLTLWLVYWFISLLWVLFWFYERHFTSQLSVLREGWITLRWGHWLEDLWTPAKYPQIPTTWSYFFGEDDDIDHWFLTKASIGHLLAASVNNTDAEPH